MLNSLIDDSSMGSIKRGLYIAFALIFWNYFSQTDLTLPILTGSSSPGSAQEGIVTIPFVLIGYVLWVVQAVLFVHLIFKIPNTLVASRLETLNRRIIDNAEVIRSSVDTYRQTFESLKNADLLTHQKSLSMENWQKAIDISFVQNVSDAQQRDYEHISRLARDIQQLFPDLETLEFELNFLTEFPDIKKSFSSTVGMARSLKDSSAKILDELGVHDPGSIPRFEKGYAGTFNGNFGDYHRSIESLGASLCGIASRFKDIEKDIASLQNWKPINGHLDDNVKSADSWNRKAVWLFSCVVPCSVFLVSTWLALCIPAIPRACFTSETQSSAICSFIDLIS